MVQVDGTIIKFFWQADNYVENSEMLIEFKDRTYIPKIWFENDGTRYFLINDVSPFFTKKDKEDLIFIEIHSSTLLKKLDIKNFF